MRNPFDSSDALAREVAAEQVRAHYAQIPGMVVAPTLGALFTAWVLWSAVDRRLLVGGLLLLLLLSSLRLLLYVRFQHLPPGRYGERRWRVLAVLASFLSGCLWGGVAPLLYPHSAATGFGAFLLVLLTLLPIVPVAALAGYMPAFYAYLLPCAGPFILTLAAREEHPERMAAVLVTMMCLAMTSFARRHAASLAQSLRLRAELAQRTEELQAAVRAKTQFIAAAGHDLRQPVQAMGLFLAALRDEGGDRGGNALVEHLDASLRNLRNMLTNMLDVSRLDAEVVRPQAGAVAVDALFDRLLAEYRPLALQAGLVLRRRGARGVQVLADAALLERMLRNLLANALKYTAAGGVTLVCRPRGAVVRLQVFDSGAGIASQHQGQVFDAYVRLDDQNRSEVDGLGLGLSIASRFALLQGQQLRLRSRPGRGSVFSIEAAADPASAAALAAVGPTASVPAGPVNPAAFVRATVQGPQQARHVLVVDDEPAVAAATVALLRRWGHTAVSAPGEAEALAAWQRDGVVVDLLIVDFRLAGGASGLDLAARLQRQCSRPLQVIVITGDTDPARLRQAQAAGHLLLHKPVDPQRLRAVVDVAAPGPASGPGAAVTAG